MTDSPETTVRYYHHRTKHRLDGYARGPETLDWDDQPDPFRRYCGTHRVMLPLVAADLPVPFSRLTAPEPLPAHPVSLTSVAMLLEMSLALSAWKQYGTARWSLRVNPSSGNLHPTEAFVVVLGVPDLRDGLYHYAPEQHQLELRCAFPTATVRGPSLSVGFSSVHWREAWKYGERAFRYCQHDVGHAAAALSYAAATLGWRLQPQYQLGSRALGQLLGLDREADYVGAEGEHPDLLLTIRVGEDTATPALSALLDLAARGQWQGRANVLDPKHLYAWPIIDEVAAACARSDRATAAVSPPTPWHRPLQPLVTGCKDSAPALFRRRRSAQAFDSSAVMSQTDFQRCLDQLFPRPLPPWDTQPWPPRVHLALFIHRVEGLPPGLYALPRSESGLQTMQRQMRAEFHWRKMNAEADALPLYQLLPARAQRTAAKLSCLQAIAGDSCFSLAMLAEFDDTLSDHPWRYPELFWEAGAIGQVLYLEAEAAGLRGTGIGCYFDDAVHDLLGLQNSVLQSIYHFTLGVPLVDHRITTLPAYSTRRA